LRTVLLFAFVVVAISACASSQMATDSISPKSAVEPASKIILASEIEWKPLNPARGDKSPKAGALWGDRTGSGPSGFLVKFVDGFSSPPHIHNITYRGVVINGLIHNDDPETPHKWMPKGSYWTQPVGEVHITATKGSSSMAYIEIEEGPYLVLPTKKAFDNGEKPVKLNPSNIVWIDQPGMSVSGNGPKVATLWGKPQDNRLNGTLVKFPVGFTGKIRCQGSIFRAVMIQGRLKLQASGGTDVKTLDPGSYFNSKGETAHRVSCEAGEECVIYLRMMGKFDVVPSA